MESTLSTSIPVIIDSSWIEGKISAFFIQGGFAAFVGSGDNDATLSVDIQYSPLSVKYSNSRVPLFTGASLEGTLLLTPKNKPAITKRFTGEVSPPFLFVIQVGQDFPGRPEQVPLETLEGAFDTSSFFEKLSEALAEAFTTQSLLDFWVKKMPGPWAEDALIRMGVPAIHPMLKNLGTKPMSQEAASRVLTRIGNSDAIPSFLQDSDARVRWCVVDALGRLAAASSMHLLVGVLAADQDASVRQKAAFHLGRWPEASDALRLALRDSDPSVRRAAADSLATVGDKGAVPVLEDALKGDKDAAVRLSPLSAIERLGAPEKVTASRLIALRDPDTDLRKGAVYGLRDSGDPRSIGPLIEAMRGQPIGFREFVAEALKRITTQDFGLDPQAWARWWEAQPQQ